MSQYTPEMLRWPVVLVVFRYRIYLEQKNLAPSTVNVRVAAVRPLAYEAVDNPPHGKSSIPIWVVNAWPIRRIWRMRAVAGKMLYSG